MKQSHEYEILDLFAVPMVLPKHVESLKTVHEESGCLHAPVYETRVQGIRRLVHVVPSENLFGKSLVQIRNFQLPTK